jgi:Dolichyl-phosphate-mannose-protein mannosyltransferase
MRSTVTLAGRRASPQGWAAPFALFVGAALVYSLNLGRLPHPDELHHVLAAKGLLESGEPRIAEGLYTRTLMFTWLVARSFALFGESLSAARLPALLPTAALVALLFVWLRHVADARAAWLGALLFALSPFAVDMAQFSRFYALQMLSLFGAAVCAYEALEPNPPHRRLGLALAALAAAALAFYLQPTTIMGLAGLCSWLAAALLLPVLLDPATPRRRKLALASVLAGLGVLVLLVLLASGSLPKLWAQYRSTPLFNRGTEGQFWYYHARYSLLYPSLWPATGILALAALAARPRPASFLAVVFAVAFLLSSFGAAKSLRYIAYAQPFLFALWGVGLAALWAPLGRFLRGLGVDLRATLPRGWPAGAWLARAMLAVALAFLVLANPAWLRTATLLAGVTIPPEQPPTNWPAAREALEPWLARAGVVVTTEELGTLYFLGRYDVRYSPSKLEELAPSQQREFGIDHRTGRPVIATQPSLERLMDCYGSGVILGPAEDWGKPHKINDGLARLITERATPIELPARSRLFAYGWDRSAEGRPPPSACAGLPAIATAQP